MKSKKLAFSILELIFLLIILALIVFIARPKFKAPNITLLANRLVVFLTYTRFLAMNDNMYEANDKRWYKKRWTFKLQRCKKSEGGLYFSIFSDTNKLGHINKTESFKDPLEQKWLYVSNSCILKKDESPFVLLSKNYDIKSASFTCNKTKSLGQISFGYNGEVFASNSNYKDEAFANTLTKPCFLNLENKDGVKISIKIPRFFNKIAILR